MGGPIERTAYLAAVLVGAVLVETTLRIAPDAAFLGAPVAGILVAAYLAGAVTLWWLAPPGPPAAGPLRWFLIAFAVLWAYAYGLTVVRGEEAGASAIVVPVLLAMLLVKPVDGTQARRAGDLFAAALVVASALTVALEALDAIPSWYELDPGRSVALDVSMYWLPIDEPLGLLGRWSGPFVHPNLAGAVGAFLLVFGLTRPGLRRLVFASSGVVVLLLSGSRTGQLAGAAGVAVLVATWWVTRPSRWSRPSRIAIAVLPAVLAAAAVVARNPNLTGRTDMWPGAIALWQGDPVLGVGQTGFNEAIAQGTLDPWVVHAHNLWLDAGVRFGAIGLALAVAVTVLAVSMGWSAARHGQGLGLALVAAVAVAGLTDVSVNWRYLALPTAAFLLAVLASQQPGAGSGGREGSPLEPRDEVEVGGADPGRQ